MATGAGDRQNPGGLSGIRVLEMGGGFGAAWVSKLFADLGADVVRYESDDDMIRRRPHDVHQWINANKRSMTNDFDTLVAEADVVLHSLGPTAAKASGLDYEHLADLGSSQLVVGAVTPYGLTGPYADFQAEELNVIHSSSWGFLSPSAASDPELPPLKAPGHHASIVTGNIAAAAILAAFDKAERTGTGGLVDFSTFAASAKLTETAPAGASYLGDRASRLGVKTIVPWAIYECSDGWVQVICVEQTQWEALIDLMGNPEWASLEVFATNADRQDNADLLHIYLSEWLIDQKADDVYRAGQAARIPITPVNTMEQLVSDAQLKARQFMATTPGGLSVPGAGFKTDQDWWALRSDAPGLGADNGDGWLDRPASSSADVTDDPGQRPLDGIKVCDFTWVWAGPFCTQLLAHLGADVVRLESPEHLCLFRRLPFNPPDVPLDPDSAGVFHSYNSDKRGVAIDLGHPDAKDVVRRMVAECDVVIDNFGVGVMAQLGFGLDDVRTINPDVIVASLTGYGQDGPSSGYMAYGPAGGAFSGLYAANGYEGGQPSETGVAVGDPGTGVTAAWSIVASLVARRRTGVASRIDVAMVEAMASTAGELWMEYTSEGVNPPLRGNRDVQWAPHGCFPAAGDDEWISLACVSDEAWQRLADLVGDGAAADARFVTESDRKRNESALDDLIGAWTATHDQWELSLRLQAAGVAAMPSLAPLDLWEDNPQLEALGMLERPVHPVTGDHVVAGIPWTITGSPSGLRRAAPTLGQHTDEVLGELGYSADEILALRDGGALPG